MPIKGYKLWLESTAQPAWGKRGRVTTGVELDDYVDLGEKFKENFGGFYYDPGDRPVGSDALTTVREGEWSCPWCPATGDHNEREYWSTHFVEDHDVKDTDGIPVVTGGIGGGE